MLSVLICVLLVLCLSQGNPGLQGQAGFPVSLTVPFLPLNTHLTKGWKSSSSESDQTSMLVHCHLSHLIGLVALSAALPGGELSRRLKPLALNTNIGQDLVLLSLDYPPPLTCLSP